METLTAAVARLQESGFNGSWLAKTGGMLHCTVCGADVDACQVLIDEIVRFEGPSDPADEAILYALTGPCNDRGLYSSSYGHYASEADREVAGRLRA
jgi:hypothetical protein